MPSDFYEVLGLERSATGHEVTNAYRKLALKYGSDRHPDKADAQEKYKEISAAYEVLSDEEQRIEYDRLLGDIPEDDPPSPPKEPAAPMRPMTVFVSLKASFPWVIKTSVVMLPLLVVIAVVEVVAFRWWIEYLIPALAAGGESAAFIGQIGLVATAILGLYTALQVRNRRTASRRSWFPSLFLVSAMLVAASSVWGGTPGNGEMMALVMLVPAFYLPWGTVAWAVVVIAAVMAVEAVRRDERPSFMAGMSAVWHRWMEVSTPVGARQHIVTAGIQVVIPGIYYALQFAFTGIVAVLTPDVPALRRSAALTRGIHARLFRLFFLWFFVWQALYLSVAIKVFGEETGTVFTSLLLPDPRLLELDTLVGTAIVGWVSAWWLLLALLAMYYPRAARWEQKFARSTAE